MDLRHLVSSDSEENLKCFVCKHYLSYFPISLCSNNQSLCGRCTPPEDLTHYQDKAFETLCRFVRFPCRYHLEGCMEELVPEGIPQHEQTCGFRKVECVLAKLQHCNWYGPLPTLLQHCQDEHSDVFLKNGEFEMDMSSSEEKDYFLEHDNNLIHFTKKFDFESKKLLFSLCGYENQPVDTTSNLSLKCGKMTLSYECKLTSFDAQVFSELFLHTFCFQNNEKLLLGKINIGEVQNLNDEGQSYFNEINSELLSLLYCSRCKRLATPPFWHSEKPRYYNRQERISCSNCEYNDCDSNETKYDSEECNLSKIIALMNSHCLYAKNGCTYFAKYQEMLTHYKCCQYADIKCFVSSCSWTGLSKYAVDHISVDHPDMFSAAGTEFIMTFKDSSVECRLIKMSNFLFKLSYKVGHYRRLMWSVQMLGCCKEKFKYQIYVGDKERGGLSLWQFCTQVTETKFAFEDSDMHCYLEKEQLWFKSENDENPVVAFKVKIFK